jgi:hypothetical protein
MAKLTKAQIEEKNRKFLRLGKKQRFVQVAKDALAQAAIGKYKITTGKYFNEYKGEFSEHAMYSPNRFQIELLAPTSPTCKVCARGALFLSRARCGNAVDYRDAENTPILPDAPIEIMQLLEQFFEGWFRRVQVRGTLIGADHEVRIEETIRLSEKHNWNSNRIFVDILNNVIQNRGDYVTPDGTNLTAKTWEHFIKQSKGKKS